MAKFSIFLLSFIASLAVVSSEIHRARGIKPKSALNKAATIRSTWPPGPHKPVDSIISVPSCAESITSNGNDFERVLDLEIGDEYHSYTVWAYAMLSACLVGLSGILPMLLIPIETGESLRSGESAGRLKLLLSFAVGGLLGDVFLHLLPEAWAHVPAEEFHAGHTRIGLWVIAGLLSFLITEKIFPDHDDDEEEEEEERERERECNKQYTKLSSEETKDQGDSEQKYKQNGHHSNGTAHASNNSHVTNGDVSGQGDTRSHGEHEEHHKKSHHIKTSGWLNLLANVIDNFTHGVAVAGSYCCGIRVGFLTTCAILLHEIPHEMGDFAILLRSGFDRWQAAKAQLLTASGGLLGAVTVLCASSIEAAGNSTAWILPFTSGGFIYIALVTVVPDLLKETNPLESFKQVLLLICGILSMAFVTMLSG